MASPLPVKSFSELLAQVTKEVFGLSVVRSKDMLSRKQMWRRQGYKIVHEDKQYIMAQYVRFLTRLECFQDVYMSTATHFYVDDLLQNYLCLYIKM